MLTFNTILTFVYVRVVTYRNKTRFHISESKRLNTVSRGDDKTYRMRLKRIKINLILLKSKLLYSSHIQFFFLGIICYEFIKSKLLYIV